MSQLLTRLKIGPRLALGFGLLILLMLASSIVGITTDNIKEATNNRQITSLRAGELAQQIETQLLQARRREKDFLLRWKSEGFDTAYANYVVLNQQHTQNIRDRIADLRAITESDEEEILTSLDTIKEATVEYDQIFADAVNDIRQRGFTDTGLEGEFRVAAHALEASPAVIDNPQLSISLLEMRRNEKDYLLRGLQVDIDDTAKFTQQLQAQINALPIFRSEQTKLIELTVTYLDKFNQLVKLDSVIQTKIDDFRAQAQLIEPLLTNIITSEASEAQALGVEYEQVQATARSVTLGLLALAALIGFIVSAFIYRSITVPINELTTITSGISKGDFSIRSTLQITDEIGSLAQSVNAMADRLQMLIGGLENRGRDLQTVADVNAQISTILEVDRLLRDVSDLTKERFHLYHSHIYLLNDAGDTLVLTAGAGHVGRQMVTEKRQIALDNPQSIVASAARDRKGVIINDVRQSPTFLPHPLLPDTRSELAVPLIARGELVGVLDVQSDLANYFTQDSLKVIELMAIQIAVAISNARLYETSERISRRERAIGTIDRKIQGAISMDEILQTTVRELGKALRVPYTAIELQLTPDAGSEDV